MPRVSPERRENGLSTHLGLKSFIIIASREMWRGMFDYLEWEDECSTGVGEGNFMEFR